MSWDWSYIPNHLSIILVCWKVWLHLSLKMKHISWNIAINVVAALALGSWPRQGLTKVRAKKKPGNAKECEGKNPHTPKWTPMLEVGVPMDSWTFREQFQGSKLNGLKSFLYHWKSIKTYMSKMSSHDSFGHFKHKLCPKERPGVKLTIWFPTIKSRESTRLSFFHVACHIPLESSWQGLQLCFRPHPNRRSSKNVMGPQSRKSPNFGNFGTPIWESRDKMSFRCGPHGEA